MNIHPGHVHPVLWEQYALIRSRLGDIPALEPVAARIANTGDAGMRDDLRRRLRVGMLRWLAEANFKAECQDARNIAAACGTEPVRAREIALVAVVSLRARRAAALTAVDAWLKDPSMDADCMRAAQRPATRSLSHHQRLAAAVFTKDYEFIGIPMLSEVQTIKFLHRMVDRYDLLVGRNSPFHALDVAADLAAGPRDVDPAGAALADDVIGAIVIEPS